MNSARRKLCPRPRGLLRIASLLVALLFVMLRPACEVFAASVERHAPTVSDHGATQVAAPHAKGHTDEGICCDSVDAQALTVPASAPLPAGSGDMSVAPYSALLLPATSQTAPALVSVRRDPAPPRSYHARSLRRLD
jgi:hypothetical protein